MLNKNNIIRNLLSIENMGKCEFIMMDLDSLYDTSIPWKSYSLMIDTEINFRD
jgi:hypothetical protein